MRHGYTNLTDTDGQVVVKRYQGGSAAGQRAALEQRAAAEQRALQSFGGLVPVPRLVSASPTETVTVLVAGAHGQDLIDAGRAGEVLRACGALARAVGELPTEGFGAGTHVPHGSLVLCHGDFGPQNTLFDEGTGEVTALLDWELVCLDHPLRDLSWAEWIVRMHHPHAVDSLDALFEGYGSRPAWADRQEQMLASCARLLALTEADGNADAAAMWRERFRVTAAWSG